MAGWLAGVVVCCEFERADVALKNGLGCHFANMWHDPMSPAAGQTLHRTRGRSGTDGVNYWAPHILTSARFLRARLRRPRRIAPRHMP